MIVGEDIAVLGDDEAGAADRARAGHPEDVGHGYFRPDPDGPPHRLVIDFRGTHQCRRVRDQVVCRGAWYAGRGDGGRRAAFLYKGLFTAAQAAFKADDALVQFSGRQRRPDSAAQHRRCQDQTGNSGISPAAAFLGSFLSGFSGRFLRRRIIARRNRAFIRWFIVRVRKVRMPVLRHKVIFPVDGLMPSADRTAVFPSIPVFLPVHASALLFPLYRS